MGLIQVKELACRAGRQSKWSRPAIQPLNLKETRMFHTILLPTDGSPGAAAAVGNCMQLARAHAAAVVGLYVLPPDDLSVREDDGYVAECERPASIVCAANALRALKQAAAVAGVPCTVLSRTAQSAYAGVIATAHERQCDLIFLDALQCKPDAAEQASLLQCGIALAPPAAAPLSPA
jgi:nucleotide-binding universal stress UspA family protein